MLELARHNKARLLFASTSEVYGDPEISPQEESYKGSVNPIGTRSCYDEGKRVAESLCFDYFRTHNVEIRIARIFNTYGPRMAKNDGRVVSNFICQSLLNESITIYGNGNQTRSFIFINDFVEALNKVIFTGEHRNIYHIGNNDEISIIELTKMILKLMNVELEIKTSEEPVGETNRRCPDDSKIKKLGYKKEYELKDGLKSVINWYLKNDKK